MIGEKGKAGGEINMEQLQGEQQSRREGMVLFSVPKAQITSFLSPTDMSAIMTALSSLVGFWN